MSRELKFTDDIMFAEVMKESKDICLDLISRIINKKIVSATFYNTQQTLTAGIDVRSIRLDVTAEDSEGNFFDIEMQTGRFDELPLRFRGYQSIIDASKWDRGSTVKKLKESYIIFLCTNDPFGRNLPVYSFEPVCNEDVLVNFNTKTHWIVLNAQAYKKASENIYSLLQYMKTGQLSNSSDMLVKSIHTLVCSINNDTKRRNEMLTVGDKLDALRDEANYYRADSKEKSKLLENALIEIKKLKKQLANKK